MTECYILEIGEEMEGSSIVSIHSTWNGALLAARKHMELYPPSIFFSGLTIPNVHAAWQKGCDILSVTKYYIED